MRHRHRFRFPFATFCLRHFACLRRGEGVLWEFSVISCRCFQKNQQNCEKNVPQSQRLQNIRWESAPRHTHERYPRFVLQIRKSHIRRFKEPTWTAFRLCRVWGPEVSCLFLVYSVLNLEMWIEMSELCKYYCFVSIWNITCFRLLGRWMTCICAEFRMFLFCCKYTFLQKSLLLL